MGRSGFRTKVFLVLTLVAVMLLPAAAIAQDPEAGSAGEDNPTFRPPAKDLEDREAVPKQLIVKYREDVGTRAQAAIRRQEDVSKRKDLDLINADVVKVEEGSVEAAIEDLEAKPEVEYAEPDRLVYRMDYSGEPRFNELWGLHNTGQQVRGQTGKPNVDINALEASRVTQGDEDLVVAVIDDGVDFSHPDLADSSWTNPGEIAGNNVDDDNNGFIDDTNGYDFANDDNTVHDPGEDFHGTHVAGTIAASSNGEDVVGVAPNVKIMSVKFLGGPFASTSTAIQAIEYASDNGAKISNNSWGYVGGPLKSLENAIEKSGMLFVAAAGNDALNNDSGRFRTYPASYDSKNILSVAAVENTGSLAGFSSFGKKSVDISAPGVDVLSTVPSIPSESGATLSEVGEGKAMVTGFGVEEIGSEEARNDFVERALGSVGFCTTKSPDSDACPTETKKVLLVDDDLSSVKPPPGLEDFRFADVRPAISQAISSVPNAQVEFTNVGQGDGPSLEELKEYDYVVWATGQAFFSTDPFREEPTQSALTSTDNSNLTRYLNDGRNLIITGMDAFYADENSPFLQDTLGLKVTSDYYSTTFEGAGGTLFEDNSYELDDITFAIPFFHDIVSPAGPNATSLGAVGTPQAYEEYFSGTSMAAPHATGTAALAASEFPNLLTRPAALKRLVKGTGKPAPQTNGKTATGDLVNAKRAVTNTPPRITPRGPRGSTRNNKPKIRANVVDLQTIMPKGEIKFYLDGKRRFNFSYNKYTGKLVYPTRFLKDGRHKVRIVATDRTNLVGTKTWTFRVR